MDISHWNKQLDRTKSEVFLGKNAAFFGSLLCSLNFSWDNTIQTACTDGVDIKWNLNWFSSLPPETRKTVLMHELWHVAKLHCIRLDNRDPKIWNIACDTRINNDLQREQYSFRGLENYWIDPKVDIPTLLSEEDIYDLLIQHSNNIPTNGCFGQSDGLGDILPSSPTQTQTVINSVMQAVQQAKMANQPGNIPGGIEQYLTNFLTPIIPWQKVLYKFFTDLIDTDYTWKRPNRRYPDMYLPSKHNNENGLEHLIYFLDVSGSINDADLLRFNSEVKYIQENIRPQKLTLVQFDTKITAVKEFEIDQSFSEIHVLGRGGTSLEPVREYIIKHKPTAAIIFSDLCVPQMQKLPVNVPIIWAVIGNPEITVPFGQIIHIK